MKHRSSRNHHNGPHAAGDPLGVYMPPLAQWRMAHDTVDLERGSREWVHPSLGWRFVIYPHGGGHVLVPGRHEGAPGIFASDGAVSSRFYRGSGDAYQQMLRWYARQTLPPVGRSSLRNAADKLYASPRAVAVFIYKSEKGGYDVNAVPNCKWAGSVNGYLIGHTHAATLAAANRAARAEVKHFLEVGSKSVLVVDVNDNHRKYTLKHRRGVAA